MAYDAPDYKELMRQYNDAMKMINTLRKERDACAATPWDYDLDAIPRDQTEVQICFWVDGRKRRAVATVIRFNNVHTGEDTIAISHAYHLRTIRREDIIAWAHVNMPKDTQCQQK